MLFRSVFSRHGQVPIDAINTAVSKATGIPLPNGAAKTRTLSFNELNSEVVSGSR